MLPTRLQLSLWDLSAEECLLLSAVQWLGGGGSLFPGWFLSCGHLHQARRPVKSKSQAHSSMTLLRAMLAKKRAREMEHPYHPPPSKATLPHCVEFGRDCDCYWQTPAMVFLRGVFATTGIPFLWLRLCPRVWGLNDSRMGEPGKMPLHPGKLQLRCQEPAFLKRRVCAAI